MSQPLSKPPLAAVFSLLFICSFCLYVSHCSYSHLDFTHLVCVASRYFVKFKPTFSLNTNQRHTTHRFLCPGRTNVLSRPEQGSGVSWCSGPSEPAPLKTRHRLPTVKEQEARPKGLSKALDNQVTITSTPSRVPFSIFLCMYLSLRLCIPSHNVLWR